MKLFITTFVFIFLFTLAAAPQARKTDREVDNLKGPVKAVLSERANLGKSSGKLVESDRRAESAFTYDSSGSRLTWKTYEYLSGTLFESVIYKNIDGDKAAIYEEVTDSKQIVQKKSVSGNKSEKPFDDRYTYKFKYKYDGDGNLSEESWYQSDGSLWLRYVYKIKGNQKEELVFAGDGSLDQKSVATLDDKGNEIERLFYDAKDNALEGKETYEYPESDAKGNWTKRITSEGDKESKFAVKPREVTYRKLTYF